ncbi:MAG: hypothetical protein LC096_06260 [Bacteroidia bacterium]|nr:hypothetical protein [Bacteroidia bacterium]
MNEKLSDIEYEILDAIYFVEPFDKILSECNAPANIVADVLKQLIHKKYVVAMRFDEVEQEYVRSFIYDTDNMHAYAYLATKEGLLAHNGI